MKELIEEFRGNFNWSNKCCDYKLKYFCNDDCVRSGCPGHEVEFRLWHNTDTYEIVFHDQTIHLDGRRFAMILDFAKRLTE